MKKFTFRFQTLLKTKEIEVNQAIHELGVAEKVVYEIQGAIDTITAEIEEVKGLIQKMQRAPESLHELEENQAYFANLEKNKLRHQDELMRAQNEVGKQKQRLKTMLKEKKIIENLKEKQYNAWKQGIKKWEEKLIDEAAVLQFIRKARHD
jgi:flagellar export protein FliJ